MSRLFNRVVNIRTGKAGSEEGYDLSEFRVKFTIEKTDTTSANKCTVSVFNLSANTRNRVCVVGNMLILKAGYTNYHGAELLFAGNIHSYEMAQDGSGNWETKIDVKDGIQFLRDVRVTKSYAENTRASAILREIVDTYESNGIAASYVAPVKQDYAYKNGYCFIGRIKNMTNDITNKLGMKWSIVDNKLKIVLKDGTDGVEAVSISPSTGMIGSPERIADAANKTKDEKKNGWKVTCLLQPKVQPSSLIVVSSEEVGSNKTMQVTKVTHMGDTHESSEWTTIAECILK